MKNPVNKLLVFVFIGAIIFILPFLFSAQTIDITIIPRFLLLAITLVVLLFILFFKGKEYPFDFIQLSLFPALLLYFLISGVSLIKAINVSEGIFDLLKIAVWIILILVSTLILIHQEGFKTIIIRSLVSSSFVLAGIGILQYFDIAFGFIPGNVIPSSTMGNKNLFSAAILLLLPFSIYGTVCFSSFWKWASVITILTILLAIVLTKTRSVWLALAVATVICFLFVLIQRKMNMKRWLIFVIVSIILGVSVVYFLKVNRSSINGEKDSLLNIISTKERIAIWKKTALIIHDYAFSGVGIGNWKIVLPRYGVTDLVREARIGELHYQNPENDFLWIFAETGTLGFISYVSVFLIIIFYSLRIFFRAKDKQDKTLALAMLFGIIGYGVVSCFSFPKERIFHPVCLAIIISLVTATYFKNFSLREKSFRKTGLMIIVCSLAVLSFSIYVGYMRWKGEVNMKKALLARESQNYQFVILKVDEAFSGYYTIDAMSTPLHFYRGTANFELNNVREALRDFEKGERVHPYHIHVLNNIGTCYTILGNTAKGIEYYQKALVISPSFQDALMNLCVLYFNVKDYRKAEQTLLLCNPETKDMKRMNVIKEAIKGKVGKD